VWLASLVACDPVPKADAHLDAGRPDEAIVFYERASSLNPEARQRYARALLQAGRSEDAARALHDVETPNHDGHLVAGSLLAEQGELELALVAFEAGLAVKETPELAVNVCVARLGLDRDPLTACQDAVKAAPMDPRAYAAVAEAALRAEMPQTAKEALFRAEKHYEGDPTTALWIGEGWVGAEDHAQACAWSIQLEQPPVLFGRACLIAGDPVRAQALLEPLAADDDEAAALLLRQAVFEAEDASEGVSRHQAIERARRWERRLLEVDEVGVLTDRGRLAHLAGDVLEAEALWERAIEVDPLEAAPRANLARSLSQRGMKEAAEALASPPAND